MLNIVWVLQFHNALPDYLLEILRGQPIKLTQVVCASELDEYFHFKIAPSVFCMASKASKTKFEKFGPNI